MILGFSGTREDISRPQAISLTLRLAAIPPERFIHGGAVGADTTAHHALLTLPTLPKFIDIYPCSEERHEYWRQSYHDMTLSLRGVIYTVHDVMRPLVRNRLIAKICDHLIACPNTINEKLRSGTWATIRYAIEAGKPVTAINPDGTLYTQLPKQADMLVG